MTYALKTTFSGMLQTVVLCVLATVVAPVQAQSLVLTKLDGTKLEGELAGWNATELTLRSENEESVIAAKDLLRATFPGSKDKPDAQSTFVELVDGTKFVHTGFTVQSRQASITTALVEQSLQCSTDLIRLIELIAGVPHNVQSATDQAGDVLVIFQQKSDSFDSLSGIVGDITAGQVSFNWDGEQIPVKRPKVAGIQYYHATAPEEAEPAFWLLLHDGARLPVEQLTMSVDKLQVRTTAGLNFSISLEQVAAADYSQGKLAYLSDLEPLDQRWLPRIDLPGNAELIRNYGLPRRDQSFTGSMLTLRWPPDDPGNLDGDIKTYEKGLALRSRTVVRYRLPKGMRRLTALAGIAPETVDQGNVTLEIFADDKLAWQGEIDGESAPTAIDADLGSARLLRIVVDYGENLDFGDRLHLVEARVSR